MLNELESICKLLCEDIVANVMVSVPVSNYIILGRFLCELCEFKKASNGNRISHQSKVVKVPYCKMQTVVDPDPAF